MICRSFSDYINTLRGQTQESGAVQIEWYPRESYFDGQNYSTYKQSHIVVLPDLRKSVPIQLGAHQDVSRLISAQCLAISNRRLKKLLKLRLIICSNERKPYAGNLCAGLRLRCPPPPCSWRCCPKAICHLREARSLGFHRRRLALSLSRGALELRLTLILVLRWHLWHRRSSSLEALLLGSLTKWRLLAGESCLLLLHWLRHIPCSLRLHISCEVLLKRSLAISSLLTGESILLWLLLLLRLLLLLERVELVRTGSS